MKESRDELLRRIYATEESGEDMCTMFLRDVDDNPLPDANNLLKDAQMLEREGYIIFPVNMIGRLDMQLTDLGYEYVRNNNADNVVQINGNDNIIINGSNNIVSDNYNKIKTSIQSSELPEGPKEEILSLIRDSLSNNCDEGKKESRIRQFIDNVTGGATANLASEAIIQLIKAFLVIL